ncbi:MAG TPA: radical SAM protein [Deltaproteobacteria bacterium]|nr:radical SAM protein [Deltaproteobacteria bacterium]
MIRPPSEARSLLVRVVRGCNWNRCNFCGIYDLFDTPYSTRSKEEVLMDIDALAHMYGDIFTTAFLGDANPLDLPADFLVDVLGHLRERFPRLKRVTAYGRASSLAKKTVEEIAAIRGAGLDRVHVGLESGSDTVLRLQRKGTSHKQLIDAGKKAMLSGLELSYYFLLGLGGQDLWEEHAAQSAAVLNEVKPHFIRVRRLFIHPLSRLSGMVTAGEFREQTPEGTVHELRHLVAALDAEGTTFTCDHANNYLPVHGVLNRDKAAMLDMIDSFLALPEDRRLAHYRSIPSVI